ncbi:MAG: hypothetical protein GQ570_11920 [Helicobacteraceae bacterium]|nr:hypothetical protein [Helicobacteraceae bacterium]
MIVIENRIGTKILINVNDISTVSEIKDNSTKKMFCMISFISSIDGEVYTDEDFYDIELKIRKDSETNLG